MKPPSLANPMNMTNFARFVGIDEDELFAMPFGRFVEFLKEKGYVVTGGGIIPLRDAEDLVRHRKAKKEFKQ